MKINVFAELQCLLKTSKYLSLISDKTPSIIYADLESWFNPSCPDPGQKEKN